VLTVFEARLRYLLKIAVAVTPWLASMYFLYWLGKNDVWSPETPFRDVMTIAIVGTGMILSFLIQTYFSKTSTNNS